jgi:hypothetical protein
MVRMWPGAPTTAAQHSAEIRRCAGRLFHGAGASAEAIAAPGPSGAPRPWKSKNAIPAARGDGFQRRMTGTRSPCSTVSLAAAPTMSDEGVGHRADMTHAIRILGARPSARRARQVSRSGWADRSTTSWPSTAPS